MVEWDREIRSEFSAQEDFNITIIPEYLDLSRFNEEDYFEKVQDLFNYKYRETQPDLIITVFDPAYDFIIKNGRAMFPEVPIVFGGIIKNHVKIEDLDDNMLCVFQGTTSEEKTIDIALEQNPDANKVTIICGDGFTERTWLEGAQSIFQQYKFRLDFQYLLGSSVPDLQNIVQDLPESSFIIYFPVLEDKEDNKYVATEALELISSVTAVPIYSFWEIFVGHGSVGGYVRNLSTQAKAGAKTALNILNGTPIDKTSSFEIEEHKFVFDSRQLMRWSIPEFMLPEGSEIRFKEYSFWQMYSNQIILFSILILAQSMIIAYLITTRRKSLRSQAALKQAEQKYRTVADYSTDWEYWQNPDGSMQWTSPSCEDISGYSSDSIIEDPSLISDMVHNEDRKVWEDHQCNIIRKKHGKGIRFRIQKSQGEIRWIEHTCQAVIDAGGINLGVRANNRDITERELYKSQTQMLQSELIHVERVSTINTMSYALAHEINQPLTSIRSYAQAALRFLDQDSSEEENIKKALCGIVSDNKRATSIVNKLRDFVRKDENQLEELNVNSIIKDVLHLLNSEIILRKTDIKLNLEKSLHSVNGDKIQLQQVLLNLMTNSLDAMEKQTSEKRLISISTRNENSKGLRISISDSGFGIVEEKLEEIFKPFHTSKSKGLGIGLAISKLIIESHQGKIWAENNATGGASLLIFLPFSIEIAQ